MKRYLSAAILAAVPFAAPAATVDLTGWIENGFQGDNGAGNWTVQGTNNDSVFQSINGEPTVFFNPDANAQGFALAGEITVETRVDDDFVGFVLGYQDGEFNSTNADFWLIDWKRANQSDGAVGLALSHVTGDLSSTTTNDFWEHVGTVDEVQRGTNFGSTGWVDNTTYSFELIFNPTMIEVKVDGVTELSYTGAFTDGAFGFYNYSQSRVRYAGITEDVAPPVSAVPLPATLPMVLAGLGALGLVRRRKRG